MKVIHEWLKDYLGDDTPSAEEVSDLLSAHAFEVESIDEVEGHTVIDIKILPDRAADCLSHRGIAREIASILDIHLLNDPFSKELDIKNTDSILIDRGEEGTGCVRFSTSLVEGVTVGPSPQWLRKRLLALGQRPINNLIDITNYVMFAVGQPLHVYDLDKLPLSTSSSDSPYSFVLRRAVSGEKVDLLPEVLGGQVKNRCIECYGTELLVTVGPDNTPVALAGVKGGLVGAVQDDTKRVVIEAGNFDPVLTRRTARKHQITTDAAKRFENAPSPELALYAQRMAIDLILELAGGEYVGTVDSYSGQEKNEAVKVSLRRTNSLLGVSLTLEEVSSYLLRVGNQVVLDKENELLFVTAPWERKDLNIETEFIREVGRLHGYSNTVSLSLPAVAKPQVDYSVYYQELIRDFLINKGFSEVITYSFVEKDKVCLKNALASDKSCLRSGLKENLIKVLDNNIRHKDELGVDIVKVFEIGTVFSRDEKGVNEQFVLAIAGRHKVSGVTEKDNDFVKSVFNELAGLLGLDVEVKPEHGVIELSLSSIWDKLPDPTAITNVPVTVYNQKEVVYTPISSYPSMSRDIALWVGKDTAPETVAKTIADVAGPFCIRVRLFDEFKKGDRISYAFRLVFKANDRTLTDDLTNQQMLKVYEAVKNKDWEVR